MSFYDRLVLPSLLRFGCSDASFLEARQRLIPQARGRVLEIAVGPGANLAHYDPERVDRVVALDFSFGNMKHAAEHDRPDYDLHLLQASAEELPVPDASVDTVVVTYALCSIPDPGRALGEMRRVLAPGGRLLFSEHGLADDPKVQRWQRRLTPLWRRFSGNCHLDRNIEALVAAAGFSFAELDKRYLQGARVAAFNYLGIAVAP